MHSDAVLAINAAQGDRAAFAGLVARHQGALRAYCRRLAPGAEDSGDDIAQEALVRAWTSLPQLADPARFRPWLFRIAWRCFLQQARRRKPAFALDGNDDEAETIHGAPSTDRDVALARVDLERALARLKP
ncbi:MAG: RNA polymerase sigma factor, partial [Pseudomonadota bacterium]